MHRHTLAGILAVVFAAALAVAPGCSRDAGAQAEHAIQGATPIGPAECAACGMVVAEQPAPRGQVVHRDGTHLHFCSVGDMLMYQKAPSSHGDVVEVYVEVNDPAADPLQTSTETRPWVAAADAFYVVGVPRPMIMGPPVLVFERRADAFSVAASVGGAAKVMSWTELDAVDPASLPPSPVTQPQSSNHSHGGS